jgi:hypothetical protein
MDIGLPGPPGIFNNPLSHTGISYDVQPSPSSIDVALDLSISDGTLKAKVSSMGTFTTTLTPSGNLPSLLASGLAWPIAAELAAALPPLLANSPLIQDISIDLVTISPTTQVILGQQVTVQPSSLQIAEGPNGYLMLSGSIARTVTPLPPPPPRTWKL